MRTKRRLTLRIWGFSGALAVAALAQFAMADSTHRVIPFQAYLTDSAGRPVDSAPGSVEVIFKLYDAPESGPGTEIWSQTHQVAVTKGMVNVLLGGQDAPFIRKGTTDPIVFDQPEYLGIGVGTGPEMVPKHQIIPAIHAADSDRATQLVIPGTLTPAVTVGTNGNVGISTEAPEANLTVAGDSHVSDTILLENSDGPSSLRLTTYGTQGGGVHFENGGAPSPQTGSLAGSGDLILQAGRDHNLYIGDRHWSVLTALGSSAYVGIGTVAPRCPLEISANTQTMLRLTRPPSEWAFAVDDGGMYVKKDDDFRVTFAASGNVGIGTTSPDAKLDVNGQLRLHSAQGQTSRIFSEWGDLVLQNDAYAHFVVHIQPKYSGAGSLSSKLSLWNLSAGPSPSYAERVRLSTNGDSYILGGNVGIGTTAPAFLLHVAGDAGKPGGGSWSATSDVRLKKNVRTLTGSLDRLLQLRGVSFEFIDPAAINELPGPRIGMVAQEVEPIIPDWVSDGSDGYKRLTVRGFEALAVEALRDLRNEKDSEIAAMRAEKDTKIEALRAENEAQIEALRKHNQELEARLAGIEALLLKQANPQDPAARTIAFHEAEAVQERAIASVLQRESTEAPRLIPFQAYLTDTAGRPVEDGTYKLVFAIYDDPVQTTNDTKLWTETHDTVPVANGVVNVLLGSITPFRYMSGHPLAGAHLLFEEPRYVGVTVGNGTELVPRQQIIPAIYAADSDRAKQLVVPGTMTPAVTVASNGDVGIGTPTPAVTVAASGNVGIGTPTPGSYYRLLARSTTGPAVIATESGMSSRSQLFVRQQEQGQEKEWAIGLAHGTWYGAPGNFGIEDSNGGTRMVIDNSGNVGIGTTNPVSKLHVEDGVITVKHGGVNVEDGTLRVVQQAGVGVSGTVPIITNNGPTAALYHVLVTDAANVDRRTTFLVMFAGSPLGAFYRVIGRIDIPASNPISFPSDPF